MRRGRVWLLGLAAFASAGCGKLGAAFTGLQPVHPAQVTQRTIDRYPGGTPQRAVLEWFRAVRQADIAQAASFYAPAAHVTPAVIRFFRAADSRFYALAQPPRVVSVYSTLNRATVFTVIEFRWSAPDGRSYIYTRPQAFELQRRRQAWQLTDGFFLQSAESLVPKGPCTTC